MKTIFENNGGTYTQVDDYLLPNLSLTAEEKETNIGVWAMRHKRYLKQNHKVRYYNLLTSGKLNSYLADIEEQAEKMFSELVKALAKEEKVTEELKATDMMLWVQKMNNIRNRATEIVNSQIIFTSEQGTADGNFPESCALILFAKLQYIILASRPFRYPNGSLPAFCTISASRVFG